MSISSFEVLPNDILYEIFHYLSPIDVLQSFLLLNKRFSNLITNEHLWHIQIGDSTTSLKLFHTLRNQNPQQKSSFFGIPCEQTHVKIFERSLIRNLIKNRLKWHDFNLIII